MQDVEASVPRPIKELKGFQRVSLAPGEKKPISFALPVNQLGFYDEGIKFVVEPGTIKVMIGSSSADIRLTGEFEIIGQTTEVTTKVFFSSIEVS